MESRPAPLRSRRVCRFCLTESEPLNFIYERDHHSRPFNVPLTLQIMSCVAIEVYSADGMPQMICNNCRWNLDRSYKFKQQCKKADEALRAYPMTGTLPRPFPPINAGDNKAEFIGSSGKRSGGVEREQPVKKPRVDNGDQQQQQQQQQSAPPAPVIVSRPRGRPPRHAATPTAPAVAPATPKVERSDSNYRVSRSISEGEKKRPDNDDGQSRRRRNKGKIDTESDDEDDEEEPYSDGDDDYEPPAYVAKKLPKTPKREVLSKYDNDSGAVETDEKVGEKQIIFVRNKEGKIVRKAIKTMLPIQQQQQQQQSSSSSPPPSSHEAAETRPSTRTSAGTQRSNLKVVHNQNKTINDESSTNDVTEAEEQVKETTVSTPKAQTIQTIKKEKIEASPETSSVVPAATSTQKSVNTVKVIKRVVVRKPTGGAETTTTTTTTTKDGEPIKTTTTTSSSSSSAAATATSTTGTKVKRTIIRRIIRQGDTTREVLLNADGTPIDPAELAKLPIGNVVKRVVLKKSNNQTSQVQQSSSTTTTSTEKQQKPQQLVQKKITAAPIDTPKFELKTSQNKTSTNEKKPITTTNVAVKKPVVVSNLQLPSSSSTTTTATTAPVTKNNNATSERVLQLEKQLETQRLVIQKLQAKKQQEYETNDDMLPDRHDSEDEQELPLKRVFVKRKQSIYDEEKAYNDHDPEYEPKEQVQPLTAIAIAAAAAAEDDDATDNGDGATDADATADANTTTTTDDKTDKQDASSVEYNKTDVFIKMEASSGVDDISRELNSILESTDNVVKMQENVLNNLTEISGINDNDKDEQEQVVKMQINDDNNIDDDKTNQIEKQPDVENKEIDNATVEQGVVDEQQQQNLNTTQDLFDNSDGSICQQKNEQSMNDSVIALSQTNDTINLNDTTDTQDSLEDTLSQMEG
ncbi:dentin sialophosphoprotein-like isoform X2 [Aphidius gifuensis]|uniref:dentin sialophosphoprotein-like isoform X2 n=1 Tax=Aphidius gifuensis TaxID=684658 RepID=UPI001CDD65DC|nr:dentin sialophosphoprotein-like isoform X2 [Aphidius gifuensis]